MATSTGNLRRLNKPMRDVRQEVEKIRLHDLPQETLRQMQRDLQNEQHELENRANEVQQKLEDHLLQGRATVLGDHKKLIRQIGRDHDELGEELVKVHEALQHRILEDRLINVLGAKWRVQALEYFIMVLIFFVLGLLVFDLANPGLSPEVKRILSLADIACCIVFLAEFFFRHHYADSKLWFWRRHWIDFVTSLPLPDLEALRVGRVARVARFARIARAVRVLRVLRVIFFFWRGMDKLTDVLDVKMMKRSVLLAVVFLVLGATVIYYSEGQQEGVSSFWESIWWSFTTVVTGGFGDIHNPTTATGRVITVVLVIAGMVVVGIFTATLTSLLVGDESERLEIMQKTVDERLDAIDKRIASLDDTVRHIKRGGSYGPTGQLFRPPEDDEERS